LYLNRLKEKWGITSSFQLVVIFIVFGLTGSFSVRLGKPILDFVALKPENFESLFMGEVLYWVLRLLIIFPVYQILLLIFGALFLQFRFFWNFEKKILKRIGFKRFFRNS
jgi:hypothetical protein